MKVFVTGVTGYIGSAVAQALSLFAELAETTAIH